MSHGETDKDNDPLIRIYTSATQEGETTIMKSSTTISFTGPKSGSTYKFTGQYVATPLKEADPSQPPYKYAMTGGTLKRPNPTNATGIHLNAFRWWLEITPTNSGQALMFYSGRIDTQKNNEEDTSVDRIIIDLNDIEGIDILYDLSGRKIENATPPGIYIINGRKVVVK